MISLSFTDKLDEDASMLENFFAKIKLDFSRDTDIFLSIDGKIDEILFIIKVDSGFFILSAIESNLDLFIRGKKT